MIESICLVGGSGFIGDRTLRRALGSPTVALRALVHRKALAAPAAAVETVQGDAADPARLAALLQPGATVLNFAYGGDGSGEQLARSLADACAVRRIRRLVHVSSCSVYGRTRGELIDEDSLCAPATAYERAKLAAEEILVAGALGKFELAILRPSAVFGAGGKNLESLAMRVLHKSWPSRYLRASAMGRRGMHAVDVEWVAAAALHVASASMTSSVERFLVSQDDEPLNNYQDIEAFLAQRFGAKPYPVKPAALPAGLLGMALRAAGRSDVEPQRRYSSAKLLRSGFSRPRGFAEALEEYASWIERRERNGSQP
jgi:nucleoside-diphosphate-sugar epimerase